MGRLRTRVHGVGINDADYVTQPTFDGKQVVCPFYRAWKNMLERCYSGKYQPRNPSYIDCKVCTEWLLFSNFRQWMITQPWQDNQLDKDLLFKSNRVYSPDTCVFVSQLVNKFTTDCGAVRGDYLIGCDWDKSRGKFKAQCRNPFTKKREYLGRYTNEIEAHLAWKTRKHELACQLAESEYVTDERVAAALRVRYSGRQLQ